MADPGSELVKAYLAEHGLKMTDLQREIGDKGEQLRRWLKGERSLPLAFKALIAQKTGIPLHDLLTDRERITTRNLVHLAARDSMA